MDRVSAAKIYNGDNYTEDIPLKYYLKGVDKILMERQTKRALERLLRMLARDGEERTEEYIRKRVLKKLFVPGFMKRCGKKRKERKETHADEL